MNTPIHDQSQHDCRTISGSLRKWFTAFGACRSYDMTFTAYHLAINSMKRNMHEHMIHASVPEDSAPEQSAFTVFTPTKSASTMEPSNLRQGFV